MKTAVLIALLALAPSPGARAAGIDDCEKIKEADAYNRCLASFGPARGAPVHASRGAEPKSFRGGIDRGAPRKSFATPIGSGRVRAVFTPKMGTRE